MLNFHRDDVINFISTTSPKYIVQVFHLSAREPVATTEVDRMGVVIGGGGVRLGAARVGAQQARGQTRRMGGPALAGLASASETGWTLESHRPLAAIVVQGFGDGIVARGGARRRLHPTRVVGERDAPRNGCWRWMWRSRSKVRRARRWKTL